jgi:hypothetical protein
MPAIAFPARLEGGTVSILSAKLWHCPDLSAGGRLDLVLDERWPAIRLELDGRHLRTLLALRKARRKDGGSENPFSGFRKPGELAKIYESIDPENVTGAPSAATITAYLSKITTGLDALVPAGHGPLRIFESKRCAGFRLIVDIDVEPPDRDE